MAQDLVAECERLRAVIRLVQNERDEANQLRNEAQNRVAELEAILSSR